MITVIESDRLRLEPVVGAHAEAMFPVLSDKALYTVTGGKPPESLTGLRAWFKALQTRGPADGSQLWFTWILHLKASDTAIGYVQATITAAEADTAWLVGTRWQGMGYASEAIRSLVVWLRSQEMQSIKALISPTHSASQQVAQAAGFENSGQIFEGEEIWRLT